MKQHQDIKHFSNRIKCQFCFVFVWSFSELSVTFFHPCRYPPAGQLCHWFHRGHSSDLYHPRHRRLHLQRGPSGWWGRDGWTEEPDRVGPSARNSQGTAFISEFRLLSVRRRAHISTVSVKLTQCSVGIIQMALKSYLYTVYKITFHTQCLMIFLHQTMDDNSNTLILFWFYGIVPLIIPINK